MFALAAMSLGRCPKTFTITPPNCNYAKSPFEHIYAEGSWQGGVVKQHKIGPDYYYKQEHKSLSGTGSDKFMAQNSLKFLKEVIERYNISTVIDVPCGDVNWQFDTWQTDSLAAYVGLDVVRTVINLDKQRFCHHSNKVFAPWDFAKCALPQIVADGKARPADLVHVRDVIQHMTLRDAARALKRVVRSGARFLIATTYPAAENRNIKEGSWYPNNLLKAPFNFPTPLSCIKTHPREESDSTCLWKIGGHFGARPSKARPKVPRWAI